MRVSSVRLALVTLLVPLSLTACENSQPRVDVGGLAQAPADLSELAGGVWFADDIQDPQVDLVSGSQIQMEFHQDSLSAEAGCNTLFGGASIDEDTLVVPALASTRKACDDALGQQDAWLSDFLSSRPSIEVLDQDLWLSRGDDTVIHLVRE